MRYYNNIEEKNQHYINGNLRIDNFSDLMETMEMLNKVNKADTLFRGQPEAKFMLYSSLQRLWNENTLRNHYTTYRELIDNLIKNCKSWNNGLIAKYLKYLNCEENKMSILSIMQHYGVPTPLLDFTYDLKKSLFFATENIDYSPSNNEIENYFSVYYIYKRNSVLTVSELFKRKMIAYATKNDLETTLQFDMVLIDNSDNDYKIHNNLNIINQDGAFILNSSPSDPLEMHYFKYLHLFNKILEKKDPTIKMPNEIGGCININKKIAIKIRDYLKDNGIDKDSMYPNLNLLRTDCLRMEFEKNRMPYLSCIINH